MSHMTVTSIFIVVYDYRTDKEWVQQNSKQTNKQKMRKKVSKK